MCVTKYASGANQKINCIKNQITQPAKDPARTASRAEQYAVEIRKRLESKEGTGSGEDQLVAPLLDCDLGGVPSIPLMGWIHFDQLRPAMVYLYFTRVPETGEGLLVHQRQEPSSARYAIYGLTNCIENVEASLVELFKANGHTTLPMFQRLPTAVFHRDNWWCADPPPLFSGTRVKRLFRFAAASLWPANMERTCYLLRRYSDPWQRTLAEQAIRQSGLEGAVQRASKFDENQFDEWFDLINNVVHVEGEREVFRLDWQEQQGRVQKQTRAIMD